MFTTGHHIVCTRISTQDYIIATTKLIKYVSDDRYKGLEDQDEILQKTEETRTDVSTRK